MDAFRDLVRAAESAGRRLVHVSTDAVFDGSKGDSWEEPQSNPCSIYRLTRLEVEAACLEETSALGVRTNYIVRSPAGSSSVLEFFYHSLRNGVSVKSLGNFHVTTMYAQHFMSSIWRLLESDARGVVHVA